MLDSLTDNAPRIMATSQADLGARMEAGGSGRTCSTGWAA
jgi:hypothetical protein